MDPQKPTIRYQEPDENQRARAYSPAVISEGGRTVWIAGALAHTDKSGASILYNFAAQTRATFDVIKERLEKEGGTLQNLVTMTVFIADPRYGDEFCKIRKEIFGEGPYPASALITVGHFGRPGVLVEVQAVGVV
jgi:enamine deaminase RidA (YjgF/YER057c/UK114 family)